MNLPEFRRLSDGTLMETRSLLPEGAEPAWLDRPADDGRTHRQRFGDAQAILARIAGGWRPDFDELHQAPLIHRWIPMVADDGAVLIGEVVDHPLRNDGRPTATSLLIALDGRLLWARTISRFYRLGRHAGAGMSS